MLKKIEAKQAGNKSDYTLAKLMLNPLYGKLMLNSLYGKFGLNHHVSNSFPYLDNDVVKYGLHESETRNPLYIRIATSVTACAREFIITQAQNNYEVFAYADTDSVHLVTSLEPQSIKTWEEANILKGVLAVNTLVELAMEGEKNENA